MIKLAVEADVDEQLYELYKKCCHLEHFCVLRRMQQLMNLGSAYLVFFRLLSCLISIVQHFWLSQLLYGLVTSKELFCKGRLFVQCLAAAFLRGLK